MPDIKPIPQTIYPEKDSLDEAAQFVLDQVPITDPNEAYALLMTYHNTLLKTVAPSLFSLTTKKALAVSSGHSSLFKFQGNPYEISNYCTHNCSFYQWLF